MISVHSCTKMPQDSFTLHVTGNDEDSTDLQGGWGGEVGWSFEKCFEVLNCYRYAGWGAETGFVEELPF